MQTSPGRITLAFKDFRALELCFTSVVVLDPGDGESWRCRFPWAFLS